MQYLSFKKWLETQTLGGGISPPKQRPDMLPLLKGKGESPGAYQTFHAPGSEELPPTMKKRMKKKQKKN